MIKKVIGRDASCDYVIFDTKNRVSRKHAELYEDQDNFFIKDLNSTNGTYINGKKITAEKLFKIGLTDMVTLSVDYKIDLRQVMAISGDSTKVLSQNRNDPTIFVDNNNAIYRDKRQTIVFDPDKTQIGDISQVDKTRFITIGRNNDNDLVIDNNNISRYHCKIRMLTPVMVELEDLGSTNGTFADNEKLLPKTSYKFSSFVKVRLGNSYQLDLKKLFPQIIIIQKNAIPKVQPHSSDRISDNTPSKKELKEFNELENVWKEYVDRQNQANNSIAGYSIGGAVIGLAATVFTGGAGILLMSGGGILGRYLGQQESSKIRGDLTYEDAFLQTYACPRCKESFQKKPWITIRECFKCKTKYR